MQDKRLLRPVQSARTADAWPDDAADLLTGPHPEIGRTLAEKQALVQPFRIAIDGALAVPTPAQWRTLATLPRPVVKAAPVRAKRTVTPWMWGWLGFACGVVFWHFIGFWGFVNAAVWPSTKSERSAAILARPPLSSQKSLQFPAPLVRRHRSAANPAAAPAVKPVASPPVP